VVARTRRILGDLNLVEAFVWQQRIIVHAARARTVRARAYRKLIQITNPLQPQSHAAHIADLQVRIEGQRTLHRHIPVVGRWDLVHRILRLDELRRRAGARSQRIVNLAVRDSLVALEWEIAAEERAVAYRGAVLEAAAT